MNAVKELGKRLAARLDEDDWGYIEPFLNECATDIESLRHQLATQALAIKTLKEKCWEVKTYLDRQQQDWLMEALALPDNSTEILQDWLDGQFGEPVAWLSAGGDVSRSRRFMEDMGFSFEPLYRKPEIK